MGSIRCTLVFHRLDMGCSSDFGSCLTLGMLFNVSMPRVTHLQKVVRVSVLQGQCEH